MAHATKTVSSMEAAALLESGHAYLDVRTPEEYAAGHAPRAVNVPFWFKGADGATEPNAAFVEQVRAAFPDPSGAIIVGCRSGTRSAKACAVLQQEGFSGLVDYAGGWLAWVDAALPVET